MTGTRICDILQIYLCLTTGRDRHVAAGWAGVYTALTTKFDDGGNLDLPSMEAHIGRQIAAGVHGIIVLGSLGENGALSPSEKQEVVRMAASACRGKVPLLACVAETTTAAGCEFVKKGMKNGSANHTVLSPGMRKKEIVRATPASSIRRLATSFELSPKDLMLGKT